MGHALEAYSGTALARAISRKTDKRERERAFAIVADSLDTVFVDEPEPVVQDLLDRAEESTKPNMTER